MTKLMLEATANDRRAHRLEELEYEAFERADAEARGIPPADSGEAPSPHKLTPVDLAADVPAPPSLVPGLLARESLTLLGGPPAQGKSWVAMNLALALAQGSDFLGIPVAYRHRVMYLDYENGEHEIRRRFRALGWEDTSPGARVRVFAERPKITGDGELAAIMDEVDAFTPDLVVVDTFSSAAAVDENVASEVEDFFARVWRPLRRRGCALLVLHHTRKGQSGSRERAMDRFRGSGHLTARVDNAWLLDSERQHGHRLSFVKSRHQKAPEDVVLDLQDMPDGLVALRPAVAPPSRGDGRCAEILEHLGHGHLKASGLAKVMDVSVKTVNGYLRSLVAEGVVVKSGEHYSAK